MKQQSRLVAIAVFLTFVLISIYISGCNNNEITEPSAQTDDEYLQSTALNTAFSSDADDDDNLFSTEVNDFDSEGALNTPIDSLIRWGRRITNVNVSTNITGSGDTMKTVAVTRTISGNFIIIGIVSGSQDTIVKPFSQEQKRIIIFKRVARRPNPRQNWRVYQHSAVDGETKTPQVGKSNIVMNKIEVFKNNNLALTLYGPDFTVNMFTSRFFGSDPVLDLNRGDEVRVKVYLTSNQTDQDIVAYHWARNSFGFHREYFTMTSQTPNGSGFDRTYEKTFTIYNQHQRGLKNEFISANTRASLYDNSPALFSSTYMGLVYRVRP